MTTQRPKRHDIRKLAAVRRAADRLAAARDALDDAYLAAHLNGWSYSELARQSDDSRTTVYRRMNSGTAEDEASA